MKKKRKKFLMKLSKKVKKKLFYIYRNYGKIIINWRINKIIFKLNRIK